MSSHEIRISQGRDSQGQAVGSVYVSGVGKMVTRLDPKKCPEGKDLERLATVISLDRFLSLRSRKGVKAVLPLPVEAVLALAHRLVKMRRATLLSDAPERKADFEEVLNDALKSPNKAVRAAAAATLELLK